MCWYAGLSNSVKWRNATAITPFKVIQGHRFWYQSEAYIYDFLLMINTNLPPILHRFQVMADYWLNFR